MSKKTGIVYLIALSFFMSVALAIIVPAINTGAVSLTAFGIIFALSFVMTVVLGLVLPIPKLSAWFSRSLHQDPQTGLGKVFGTTFATTLFMLIITFVMVAVLTGVGEVDGTNYLGRYMTGFLHIQPILVVTTLLFDPLATAIAKAVVKTKS
jgi:threonine/homoserine/homoserine lactone efflux protein